jgi:hypothetical protein
MNPENPVVSAKLAGTHLNCLIILHMNCFDTELRIEKHATKENVFMNNPRLQLKNVDRLKTQMLRLEEE